MLISVDFWKSMHGFAMDSRTRDGISVASSVQYTGEMRVTFSATLYIPLGWATVFRNRHVTAPRKRPKFLSLQKINKYSAIGRFDG